MFKKYKCASCHETIVRDDPNRTVTAQFSSLDWIGTDRQMATNAILRCGNRGVFENVDLGMCSSKLEDSQQIPVLPAVLSVTEGVLKNGLLIKLSTFFQSIISNPNLKRTTQRHVDLEVANRGYLNAYKGRPLNGIWATAPYLHNGSVPNLYELFLPSCSEEEIKRGKLCRSNIFTVGNREFDTEKIGFVQKSRAQYPDLFLFDTSLPGNSNKGHEYTAGVTPMPKLDENGQVIRDQNGKVVKEWFKPITEEERIAL